MKIQVIYLLLFSCVFWGLSCSDTESVAQTAPVDVPEGLSFSSERPDADQPLTITFKAAKSSDLYGYKGDVYLFPPPDRLFQKTDILIREYTCHYRGREFSLNKRLLYG
jgi:hypothetical protein